MSAQPKPLPEIGPVETIKTKVRELTAPELIPKPAKVIEDVAVIFPDDPAYALIKNIATRFLNIDVYGEYQDESNHPDERPQSEGYVVSRVKLDGDSCYSPLLLDWAEEWINKEGA